MCFQYEDRCRYVQFWKIHIYSVFENCLSLNSFPFLPLELFGSCLSLSFFKDLFIYFFFYFLFLVVLSLRCCTQAFSSCGEQGLLLFWSMGSRCVGFSSWGSWALQCGLSRHMDLVAPWHVGSSQTRDRTHVPCIGRQILNH